MKIFGTEQKLTRDELLAFENQFELTLPLEYRELIIEYNGLYNADEDHEYLGDVLSIKYGDDTLEDAISSLQIKEQIISKKYLPIGNTPTGNLIAIAVDIEADEYGSVYRIRMDTLEEKLLASSLFEFLNIESLDEIELTED